MGIFDRLSGMIENRKKDTIAKKRGVCGRVQHVGVGLLTAQIGAVRADGCCTALTADSMN